MVQGCGSSGFEPFAEDQGHPGPPTNWSVLKGLVLDIAAASLVAWESAAHATAS